MTPGPLWYDADGNPVSIETAEELLGSRERILAQDSLRGFWVSTVHLVLDHSFVCWQTAGAEPLPPLIFETALFQDHDDALLREMIDCWRTPTKFAALACHDQVCAAVRDGVVPDVVAPSTSTRRPGP